LLFKLSISRESHFSTQHKGHVFTVLQLSVQIQPGSVRYTVEITLALLPIARPSYENVACLQNFKRFA
jgi:hypothetical protein